MDSVYIYSLVSMGGLAALLAAGLGFASKAFTIEKDDRVERVEKALPGANCGACGYAGCSAFAEAVAAGEAPVGGCPVGGEDTARALAEIMGIGAENSTEVTVAQVLCAGGWKETKRPAEYRGVESCKAANMIPGGTKACQYGCLGLGDCAFVCPFDAIVMSDNGIPEIDSDKCTACGKCVEACPRSIITLAAVSKVNHIRCSSHDQGKVVRRICEVGCIGCGICVKSCPVDAIEMKDNLAVLDYEKCVNCGICSEKCPTNAIEFTAKRIEEIKITDTCVGCTRCAKECPVEAISGELKQKHEIDPEICIKCGICDDVCKVKGAIDVKYKEE
ncbi:MAG: RnfABCDGE type electron transport complex subunit B [Halanaerobiales bacterium]